MEITHKKQFFITAKAIEGTEQMSDHQDSLALKHLV